MLNLKNTLDGYLKNVEVIGNTIQDTNNLANIRSVGDKVEGQELYKIELACYGDNILRPDFELGLWNVSNGTAQADTTAIRTKGFLRIRNQAHLVKRFDGKLGCQVILFDENFKYLGQQSYAGGNYVRYDNILPNAKYMKINFLNTTDLNLKCVLFDRVPSNINGVEFVEFQESELEILSPVQLEKVGDVADRIICKDGVWGIEKNIETFHYNGSESWQNFGSFNDVYRYCLQQNDILYTIGKQTVLSNKYNYELLAVDGYRIGIQKYLDKLVVVCNIDSPTKFKDSLKDGLLVKAVVTQSQFIPLPHDQQVKLRTFAGQTNIAFLTEIPGQIKAQVPKSLGATVNTHTEQIADLHNSLERVKKLEETTVSTVETESSFTTVDATSNGYFEDVKLEGKTLVNLFDYSKLTSNSALTVSEKKISVTGYSNRLYLPEVFACNKTYTIKGSNYGKSNSDVYTNQGKILLISKDNSINKTIDVINFNTTDIATFTIPSDYNPTNYHGLYFYGSAGNTTSIENIIILEGDHTNNPPEFFEGLMSVGQDVEEVNVESVNPSGNLFNGTLLLNRTVDATTGVITSHQQRNCTQFINVKENKEIFITGCKIATIRAYDENKNMIGQLKNNITPIGTKYIRFSLDNTVDYSQIYVGYSNNSEYVNYQSNKKTLLYFNPTTETWEKPILREWDTIEKHSDGKYYYHKRSGEVVLNGGESWRYRTEVSDDGLHSIFSIANLFTYNKSSYMICDKANVSPVTGLSDAYSKGEQLGFYSGNTSTEYLIYYTVQKSKLSTQDVAGFTAWLKANPTTVVYQLAQEEVYECTNIDLMTYSGETNYIINSGAISPKSLLKVHNNISNVVKILQEKVSLLENTFIAGLKSVLSGDMYSLATILYPEDFEQNDNTEQDIMVIPE